MQLNNVDMNKWKAMAQQILGDDFFTDFVPGIGQEGPKYNVYKNSSEVIVLIELPYIQDLSQIKLMVREQELVISGKIDLGFEQLEVVESNIFSGTFQKTIELPCIVNTKKVNANYQRGILKIQLFPRLRKNNESVTIHEL